MARVKVVLHGYLNDLYSDEIYIEGEDAAEVINGFCKQTGAFDVGLGKDRHQIRVYGFDDPDSLYAPLPLDMEEIHLMPDMRGGKGGGFFKVVLGAVLIATAIFAPFAATALPGVLGAGGATIGSALFSFGTSLLLGGLLELISPAPQNDTLPDSQDPEASKYLGATQNTVKIGTRIPLIYGKFEVFGHYLSFDIDAKDVSL